VLTVPVAARAESTVAILMSASVKEYDEAVAGFEEVSGARIIARENMNGDFKKARRILDRFDRELKPDLVFAVGVWALRAVLEHGSATPTVYSMVLNPGPLVGKAQHIAGASMNVSPERAIDVLEQLDPDLRRVGVVYNEAKTGPLVRRAEAIAKARKITLVTRAVSSAGQAVPALKSLASEGIDALWIVPDETVLAPTVLKHFFVFSYANKVPALGISKRQAEMGALLAVSFASTRDIGRQAGEEARALLAGQAVKPGGTSVREVELTVNLKVARKLGVEVPQSLLASASQVID